MTLAEALMERRDIIKKINKIKEEIRSNLVTKEDFQLPFDMDKLFDDFMLYQNKLMDINTRIDKTNVKVINDKLNQIRIFDAIIMFYKECRKDILQDRGSGLYREERRYVRNYDINQINSNIDEYEKIRRELDRSIQKINWKTELEE